MNELWLAVRWLHLVGIAFFMSGQLLLAVAAAPAERRARSRTPQSVRTCTHQPG